MGRSHLHRIMILGHLIYMMSDILSQFLEDLLCAFTILTSQQKQMYEL